MFKSCVTKLILKKRKIQINYSSSFILVIIIVLSLISIIKLVNFDESSPLLPLDSPSGGKTEKDSTGIESTYPGLSLQAFQRPSILFIVGDPSSLDPDYDEPFYDYMTGTLNYDVTYHDDNGSYLYEKYDAIVISWSIAEVGTVDSLTNATIPILTMSGGTYDEFKLGSGSGETTGDSLYILNSNHFTTQGLTNDTYFQFTNEAPEDTPISVIRGYNTIGSGVEIVSLAQATQAKTNERTWVALDKGKKAWDLSLAPERRAFWGAYWGDFLNQDGWDRWERTLKWILYDDVPGNATIRVTILDLDNRKVSNARVNLTDSTNSSNMWSQNTTNDGETTFTNVSFGYYDITVEFEDSVNSTLTFLEIAGERTYEITPQFDFTVSVSEYIDNSPPLIENVYFDDTTSHFYADIFDESSIITVNLSLTVRNTTTGEVLRDNSYKMVTSDGTQYFNDTALQGFTEGINVVYNITAIDIATNKRVSENKFFTLGDSIAPTIHEYNVTDHQNGTLVFYANITDEGSLVQEVGLSINDSFRNMYLNSSGFWVYRTNAYYGRVLNYTIYSANDSVGNENGAKVTVLTPPFGLITPSDKIAPLIWGVDDTFSTHNQGFVEFTAYIRDWNDFQSGVNVSNVKIILSINGVNITYNMFPTGVVTFSYDHIFAYNDTIYYWITASDLAGNIHPGFQHGPFIIDDNAIPQVTFSAQEFGNGIVEFNATVIDWPNNQTTVSLHYTQNYFGTWNSIPMTNITENLFSQQIHDFDYNRYEVWYYITANDTAYNLFVPSPDQYLKIDLMDKVAPDVAFTITNSSENDGEITVTAWALDSYGSTPYINNTFYVNITTQAGTTPYAMEYSSFNFYTFIQSFTYGEQVIILVYTTDDAGNVGKTNRTIMIGDFAPPKIRRWGIREYQSGVITVWAEVTEDANGSGLPADNSSIILEYTFKTIYIAPMVWNGSGNFFEYSLSSFEPGDTVVYRIWATDIIGNINSTSLVQFTVPDTTPPEIFAYGYSESLISSYESSLEFRVNASDPFGRIATVTIAIFDYNSSQWVRNAEIMNYDGLHYYYAITMVCTHVFNYSITVDDGWNDVIVSNTNLKALNFHPPEIVDFGMNFNQSESHMGQAQFYLELNNSLKDDVKVTLSVFDETDSVWVLNQTLINDTFLNSSNTVYCMYLELDYHHNFSITFQVSDFGTMKGYYEFDDLTSSRIMEDNWGPIIHQQGIEDFGNGTIKVWANVSDWGSGVATVLLDYYPQNSSISSAGLGAASTLTTVPMRFNGSLYVVLLNFSTSGTLKGFVKAIDHAGISSNTVDLSEEPYFFAVPIATIQWSDLVPLLVLVGIIPAVLVTMAFMARKRQQIRIRAQKRKQKEIVDKVSDIFSLRVVICRNQFGLAFYTENFMTSGQDEDMIAGLTSAMSSMVTEIAQREIRSGEFDVLEREGFSILSYHGEYSTISVISEEKLSSYMKMKLRELAKEIESSFTQEELEDQFITELTERTKKLVYETLPLGLLHPLTVDVKVLNDIKKHFAKEERKWFDFVAGVPSFIDGQQVFHAMTFISPLAVHGVPLVKAFSFLERCYNLGVIRNLSEAEIRFFESIDSSSAT